MKANLLTVLWGRITFTLAALLWILCLWYWCHFVAGHGSKRKAEYTIELLESLR